MAARLQPKVALRQQLIIGRGSRNVQLMVASTREAAKRAFSRNFNDALDRVHFEAGRGRTRAVAKAVQVSYESARKWLGGEAIPDQTNMLRICETLKIGMAELQINFDPQGPEFGNDSFARKLVSIWPELTDEVRGQIVAFALVHAATNPTAKKTDSQQEPTGT